MPEDDMHKMLLQGIKELVNASKKYKDHQTLQNVAGVISEKQSKHRITMHYSKIVF